MEPSQKYDPDVKKLDVTHIGVGFILNPRYISALSLIKKEYSQIPLRIAITIAIHYKQYGYLCLHEILY